MAERKFFKNNHLKVSISVRGDLNPHSGFYFPLFSMVFPWEISIRVVTFFRSCRERHDRTSRVRPIADTIGSRSIRQLTFLAAAARFNYKKIRWRQKSHGSLVFSAAGRSAP